MGKTATPFDGDLVVVTGGGSGIGLAIVRLLVQRGAAVVVAEVNHEARAVIEAIGAGQGRLRFVHCDVGQESSIDELFEVVARDGRPLTGLVNNAGITVHGDLLSFPTSAWNDLVNINMRSVFLCTQRAARLMGMRQRGSIVNIASNHAGATNPGFDAYSATKAGVCAMTRAMAWSLGPLGIRVNSLSPGLTATPHIRSLIEGNPALEEFYRSLHATGRFGEPEDVAQAAAFLLSEASLAITGSDLLADNGMSARLFHRTKTLEQ